MRPREAPTIPTHSGFELLPGRFKFQSSIEELNVVSSMLLDPIHCCVCVLDQRFPIPTVLWKDADAHTSGDIRNVRREEVMWDRDGSENLFCNAYQTS